MYLESKHAIPASVDTMFPIASRRAVSMRSRWCWVAMFWSAWFSALIAFAFQKYAIAVCAGGRTALVAEPYASVSFRSLAYCALVSAGGGGARNREVLASMNGCIPAIHGVCAICSEGGGPQIHRPGCSGPAPNTVETCLFSPSLAR